MAETVDRAGWKYASHIISAIGSSVGADCKASDFNPYDESHKVSMVSADEWKMACGALSRVTGKG